MLFKFSDYFKISLITVQNIFSTSIFSELFYSGYCFNICLVLWNEAFWTFDRLKVSLVTMQNEFSTTSFRKLFNSETCFKVRLVTVKKTVLSSIFRTFNSVGRLEIALVTLQDAFSTQSFRKLFNSGNWVKFCIVTLKNTRIFNFINVWSC